MLAVIVTEELVLARLALLVKSPVPVAVMVTLLVTVVLLLRVMLPFVAVLSTDSWLAEMGLPAVMLPLAVSVSVPLVEARAPLVPIFADAPVVVIEKLPPTVEAPNVTAPALDTVAVPGLPVLVVKVVALVSIGVPTVPISPVPDWRAIVVPETVTLPVLVMAPEPLAVIFVVVPPPTLALIAIAPLLVVARVTVPPEVTVTADEAVNPTPVMDTVVLPPVTAPVLAVPKADTVRVLVPRVIVCPSAV